MKSLSFTDEDNSGVLTIQTCILTLFATVNTCLAEFCKFTVIQMYPKSITVAKYDYTVMTA